MSQLLNPEEIRVLQLFTNYFKETEVHRSYSPKQILEKIMQIYFCVLHKRDVESLKKNMNIIDSAGETFSDLRKFQDGFLTFNQRQNSHIPPTFFKILDVRYYSHD